VFIRTRLGRVPRPTKVGGSVPARCACCAIIEGSEEVRLEEADHAPDRCGIRRERAAHRCPVVGAGSAGNGARGVRRARYAVGESEVVVVLQARPRAARWGVRGTGQRCRPRQVCHRRVDRWDGKRPEHGKERRCAVQYACNLCPRIERERHSENEVHSVLVLRHEQGENPQTCVVAW